MLSENNCGIIFLYNGELGVATDSNGLYYMRARYYNPEIKRFINQDVMTGSITNSPTLNRYAYVNGNPISLNDPFGLSPLLNWLGHTALDLLGMVPVVGFVFDLANAFWYLNEDSSNAEEAANNKFMAICSFVSAIPGMGDCIGAFVKDTNTSCKLVTFFHTAGNVGNLGTGFYSIGKTGWENFNDYWINDNKYDEEKARSDLFSVGLTGLSMWFSAKDFGTSYCFVAGTLVTTADGQKPIEEIKVGDKVLSENEMTGEVEIKEVYATSISETDEFYHIHVNGEEIVATGTHPFYVYKFGWTTARALRAGDILVLSNGELVTIEFVQHEILESPINVYNFEVEDFHTYFVGESGILVHNGKPCTPVDNVDNTANNKNPEIEFPANKNGYFGDIGQSGNGQVRNMSGGEDVAQRFFEEKTRGYVKEKQIDGGKVRLMPDNTAITYRSRSHSDGTPAVDINNGSTYKKQKIHFTP